MSHPIGGLLGGLIKYSGGKVEIVPQLREIKVLADQRNKSQVIISVKLCLESRGRRPVVLKALKRFLDL